jgi:hypothetical protein
MSEPAQPEPQPEPTEPTEPTEPSPDTEEEEAAEEGGGGESPEEPAQPDPETEPPQPEGLTQAQWEERFVKSEKAWHTYAKRIDVIWEEDALNLVPLTISPSAPSGFLSPADAGRIPDEVKGPLLEFLGLTPEVEYETSAAYSQCTVCKGKGRLKTGSLVAGEESNVCPTCSGRGYVSGAGVPATSNPPLAAVPVQPNGGEPPAPPAEVDRWGIARIMEDGMPNPNYGKTPDYWDRSYPVGNVG